MEARENVMSLFKKPKPEPKKAEPEPDKSSDPRLPILPIDLAKRYDVYCNYQYEERIYEDMLLVAIRTYESKQYPGSAVLGGYIELEARDGKRMMVPSVHIRLLCEHGAHPTYKIVRSANQSGKGSG
jgi:hypothetical protein